MALALGVMLLCLPNALAQVQTKPDADLPGLSEVVEFCNWKAVGKQHLKRTQET